MINAEHTATIQTYLFGPQIRRANIHTGLLWYAGGPRRPKLQEIAVQAFQDTGVVTYAEPERAAPGGEMSRLWPLVPGVQGSDYNMYFHSDHETDDTVPWTGLEAITRAYAKIIDGVNTLPLSDLQRPPDPTAPPAPARRRPPPRPEPSRQRRGRAWSGPLYLATERTEFHRAQADGHRAGRPTDPRVTANVVRADLRGPPAQSHEESAVDEAAAVNGDGMNRLHTVAFRSFRPLLMLAAVAAAMPGVTTRLVGQGGPGGLGGATRTAARDWNQDMAMKITEPFTLASVGDVIIMRPASEFEGCRTAERARRLRRRRRRLRQLRVADPRRADVRRPARRQHDRHQGGGRRI